MADRQLDVLFIHPSSSKIYQSLRPVYSCVETPTWSLLLAQSCRAAGFGVAILDVDAEELTDSEAVKQVKEANPRLVVFECYGSEPNQSTVRMGPAVALASLLKEHYPEYKICFVGNHVSALPKETLAIPCIDFILLNEGVYALRRLLSVLNGTDTGPGSRPLSKGSSKGSITSLNSIKGIGWKESGGTCYLNDPEQIVPQAKMDFDLPGYAWDLIEVKKYRSHFWHGQYKHANRTPFAALYTSLGCPMKCSFCCINIVSRTNNSEDITAADSAIFRYWTPEHTLKQMQALVARGVTTIRLSDEMFYLKPSHYEPLLKGIKERWGDSLHLWAYARVDSVKRQFLELFRSAGVRWLALGIESANQNVRREIEKGRFEEVDIRRVVKEVEDAGIEVIANYIFGLPQDDLTTMQETLALSIELNTSMWNAYPCMVLPGSPLYLEAKRKGLALPASYEAFGFLSYECQPLPTEKLTAAEILNFRDKAFRTYWSRPEFLSKIERKFGVEARANIEQMLKIRLKRKLLGDPQE